MSSESEIAEVVVEGLSESETGRRIIWMFRGSGVARPSLDYRDGRIFVYGGRELMGSWPADEYKAHVAYLCAEE